MSNEYMKKQEGRHRATRYLWWAAATFAAYVLMYALDIRGSLIVGAFESFLILSFLILVGSGEYGLVKNR